MDCALRLGLLAALCATHAAAQVVWTNTGGSANLTSSNNWSGNAVPTSSQVAVFNLTSFGTNLHLQNQDWHVGGIELASGAGSLTFDSSGGGSAQTIYVGSSGLVNNATGSTLALSISTKVNLALEANASFVANGPIQIISDGASFTLGGFTLTLDGTNGASSISQAIGGSGGSLVKTGTGTWTLSGANTYTGTTTVAQGTLSVGSLVVTSGASHLGNASSPVILGGASTAGTLAYTGNSATFTRGFTVNAGGGSVLVTTAGQTLTLATGGVATSGAFTIGGAGHTTINSAVTGAGSLVKTGTGTLTLAGSNTQAGVAVSGGTLLVQAGAQLAAATAAVTITGGTLNLSNTAQTLATLLLSGGSLTGSAAVTLSAAGSDWSGGTLDGTGTLTLGTGGTLAISSAVTHALGARPFVNDGTVNWTGGDLTLGTGGSLTNRGTFNAATAGTLSLAAAGAALTNEAGAVFNKFGAGTATVAVPVTNRGTVSATGGTLAFTDTFTNANGNFALANGATLTFASALNVGTGALGGAGTLTAPSVTAGGVVSPGNSPGTLNLSGDLTLLATSTLLFEIGGTTAGTNHDVLNVTGTATLGGTLQLKLINGFVPLASDTFTLLNATGGFVNFPASTFANVPASGSWLATLDGAGAFQVNFTATTIQLTNFSPIPEPSTYALLGTGAAVLALASLRRRARG
jgi:autotransporter-associated beta strand protein